jgi:neutral ceramidase
MKLRDLKILLVAFGFLFHHPAVTSGKEASFKAGIARRDITPQEPVPMWGYGARRDALSEGTLDPLLATALVIEAGGTALAIVALDLGRSPSEQSLKQIRERLAEAGIEHSFICGSHTHHGPVLELSDEEGKGRGKFDAALRYYADLEAAIVAAVLEAKSKALPVKLAVGSRQLDGFNRNRHSKLEPRPVDRELVVMRLDSLDGKTLAVLVNFAAHTTMVPAATLKFSTDFAGPLREVIETELNTTALFMQGAAGDLSVNRGPHQDHIEYGRALGSEAAALARELEPQLMNHPSLKVREDQFTFKARIDVNNPLVALAYAMAFFPELVANYMDEYRGGVRPRLTVALLNEEIALVGLSGEVFSAHALRLKERNRTSALFFFGYCNGYHQYFPTIEAVAEGGYGADPPVAPVEIGAGEQLMNTALIWIYEMMGKF